MEKTQKPKIDTKLTLS